MYQIILKKTLKDCKLVVWVEDTGMQDHKGIISIHLTGLTSSITQTIDPIPHYGASVTIADTPKTGKSHFCTATVSLEDGKVLDTSNTVLVNLCP